MTSCDLNVWHCWTGVPTLHVRFAPAQHMPLLNPPTGSNFAEAEAEDRLYTVPESITPAIETCLIIRGELDSIVQRHVASANFDIRMQNSKRAVSAGMPGRWAHALSCTAPQPRLILRLSHMAS